MFRRCRGRVSPGSASDRPIALVLRHNRALALGPALALGVLINHLRPITTVVFAVALASGSFAESQPPPRVLFVDAAATGANHGSSWMNAFVDLQSALDVAQSGDEIWVAHGRYMPSRRTIPDDPRSATFGLIAGVALFGGFAGGETARAQADPFMNETILSGDFNGDDGQRDCSTVSNCCATHEGAGCDDPLCNELICGEGGGDSCCSGQFSWDETCVFRATRLCTHLTLHNSDNAYHVLTGSAFPEPAALLDGLTITGGNADITQCVTFECWGGGLYNNGASIQLSRCRFKLNSAYNGGGGLFTAGPHSVVVRDCEFVDNDYSGWFDFGSAPLMTNSCFRDNLGNGADLEGGSVLDSVFERNSLYGLNVEGTAEVHRCRFNENGRAGLVSSNALLLVRDSMFVRNNGPGIGLSFGVSALVTDCTFRGDSIGCAESSALIDRCVFVESSGDLSTTLFTQFGSFDVRNSLFLGNTSRSRGAAAGVSDGVGLFTNCLFAGNHSTGRSIVSVSHGLKGSFASFQNCTFANNRTGFDQPTLEASSTIGADDLTVLVGNCLFWGNQDATGFGGERAQILNINSHSDLRINNTIVAGWTGLLGGVGNSGADPLFVDANGPDDIPGTGDDDLRLQANSPAINAGDPTFTPDLGQTDLSGVPRVLCGRVDIGAYEFGIGDFNCDRRFDLSDFRHFPFCMFGPDVHSLGPGCEAFDFDANSDIDLLDFAGFQRTIE